MALRHSCSGYTPPTSSSIRACAASSTASSKVLRREPFTCSVPLAYAPTNVAHDGKFRKVKIDMVNHDFKVLARKGYYAPKE